MEYVMKYISVIQAILAVLLIITIIIQQNDESLGGSFGGSDTFDTIKRTRRGAEKKLFSFTIWLAILFVLSSILHFFWK